MSSGQSLITAIADGDEAALRQLYEGTCRDVYRYLYRFTGDENLAEELTVETYTEVWRSAAKCRGEAKALTWIIGIARILALNRKRKTASEPIDYDTDLTQVHCPVFPSQLSAMEASQSALVVKSALDRLDSRHREVIDLFFLQEFNYQEIAAVLKIPLNTAKTRIFNAKSRLASMLGQMGFSKDDLL